MLSIDNATLNPCGSYDDQSMNAASRSVGSVNDDVSMISEITRYAAGDFGTRF